MLHFSTETYNNEQVSKVFGRISAETCLKMDYFGSKFPKIPKRWGSAHDIIRNLFGLACFK